MSSEVDTFKNAYAQPFKKWIQIHLEKFVLTLKIGILILRWTDQNYKAYRLQIG